jgi:hypothetical protein
MSLGLQRTVRTFASSFDGVFAGRAGAALLFACCPALGQGPAAGRGDPQELVDLAAPGSIVVVPSGTHGPLLVTKPLTLVGERPMPTLGRIVLEGPGGGRLTLANLHTEGPAGVSAPIQGDGFSELHVSDCDLTGYLHVKGLKCLEVSRSTLRHSGTVGPYIAAPGATTTLMDVVLEPLPPPLQNPTADVVTARLGLANCSIPGRIEAKMVHQYPNDLVLAGNPRPGGLLDLAWTTPAPSVIVFAATGTRHPTVRPDGIWFLERDARIVAVEVSPGGMSFPIPATVELLGQRIAFQAYDWVPPSSISRPVLTVLH